jgi:hypothetical protein
MVGQNQGMLALAHLFPVLRENRRNNQAGVVLVVSSCSSSMRWASSVIADIPPPDAGDLLLSVNTAELPSWLFNLRP